jgi:methylated-DNA-[protein]-cysteine S-methyltransferase
MELEMTALTSPLGELTAAWHDDALCAFGFSEHWPRLERGLRRRFGAFTTRRGDGARLQARLDAYFAGDLAAFDELALDPGGTAFQRAVWDALRRIPPGATTTYGALAQAIANPAAVRAVGAANGANPIWLMIPCHRAIAAGGALTGYAGGLERKRWLLRHEGALLA